MFSFLYILCGFIHVGFKKTFLAPGGSSVRLSWRRTIISKVCAKTVYPPDNSHTAASRDVFRTENFFDELVLTVIPQFDQAGITHVPNLESRKKPSEPKSCRHLEKERAHREQYYQPTSWIFDCPPCAKDANLIGNKNKALFKLFQYVHDKIVDYVCDSCKNDWFVPY